MRTVGLHLFLAAALAATACGSSSSAPASGLPGIPLPAEVSAVPPKSATATGMARAALTLSTLPDSTTDYGKAATRKYVDERALSQFDILNTIFNAMGQTHYADEANVNAGPYVAIVSWLEENNGTQSKMLQRWIVDSRRQDAQSDNLVQVWMPDMQVGGDGQTELVEANLVIKQAPTRNTDGSYSDFGAWRLDVSAPNVPGFRFVATAEPDTTTGRSLVRVFQESPGNEGATKGILSKGATDGFGKVWFPDRSNCTSQDCTPEHLTAVYAYDANDVVLRKGMDPGTAPLVAKSRGDVVDIVNRYGLFDATTGADVSASRRFGFPISYGDSGQQHWASYGAWQGRHNLWANGQQLDAGVVVTRADRPAGSAAETYTTSAVYSGLLVKRTLAPTTLDQIVGAIAQTNVSFYAEMTMLADGTWWTNCNIAMPDTTRCTTPGPGDPRPAPAQFTSGFDRFATDPSNTQRWVNLMGYDERTRFSGPVVYLNSGVPSPGFYKAAVGGTPSPNGPPPMPVAAQPLQLVDFGSNSWLTVNLNENVYVSYTDQGWVQKKVASFDAATNTPTFDPGGDTSFALDQNREYYLNDAGVNYVVTFDGTAYSVKVEQQSVANPVNAATFLQEVSYLKQPWGSGTTYAFDAATLKLTVKTSGQGDPAAAGSAVTTPLWGLAAYDVGNALLGAQFNWDYPQGGSSNGMGIQQFLIDENGALVVLDDPIRLKPEPLADGAGKTKTYSLQFDGSCGLAASRASGANCRRPATT